MTTSIQTDRGQLVPALSLASAVADLKNWTCAGFQDLQVKCNSNISSLHLSKLILDITHTLSSTAIRLKQTPSCYSFDF